jgi:nanoRNase/pAp phosphatase (c-di-AMP/oligoRNAs hydrolase)/lysophospholipase L1-like esterase
MTSFFVLGDSISVQYGPYLAERIRPFGTYARKEGVIGNLDIPEGQNGGDSSACLRYLRARFEEPGFRPDWLVLNCGLHDIKRPPTDEPIHQVPPEVYRANLRAMFDLVRDHGVRLCWVRTTPAFENVHNVRNAAFHRFAADVDAYNAITDELCAERGIPVIDLHGFTLPYCPEAFEDHIHFGESMRALQAAFIAGHLERLARDTERERTSGSPVPEDLVAALAGAKRVVVLSHVKPDGDAFGSALGLVGYLRAAGHAAISVGLEPVPQTYAFLEGIGSIVPAERYEPADGDVVAICDCGALDRIPAALREVAARLPSVCIDHHKTNSGFAGPAYIDPAASSASELVWRIGRRAGWPLDAPTAEALWVGLVTDTGRFAYDCTSPATLRCAADVLERGGVRTAVINELVYGQVSEAQLRLQARAIGSLVRSDDGRVAVICLTQDDYVACATTSVDSENFVDIARSIRGVNVAAFLYAGEGGRVSRLSLRSLPPHDASDFCQKRGGGGHARAAGATLPMPVPEARTQVLKDLEAWIANSR